jgi:streptogramin lyase
LFNRALAYSSLKDDAKAITDLEQVVSMPGTPEQKSSLDRCTSCHTLERALKSTHDVGEFIPVLQRMGSYAPGTTPLEPWRRRDVRADISAERLRPRADYLASINLSQGAQWDYALKTLPRLKGRSTRVVITEYDLPRPTTMPHDVILDPDGIAWFTDFGHQVLGKLDPGTGKVTEYQVPTLKPDFPPGLLDIELDQRGDLWVGLMLQAGIAKFDRRSETFTMFPLPKDINTDASQQAMVMPSSSDVDGKVWMNSAGGLAGIHRMDLASKTFETFRPYQDLPKSPEHSVYGIKADSKNNLYFFDFAVDFCRTDRCSDRQGFALSNPDAQFESAARLYG